MVGKKLYITIEVFGMHGIIANTNHIQMPITDNTTVNDAIYYITKKYPGINIEKGALLIAVNHEIASSIKVLQENDIVSLFPHIGGG